MKNYTIEEYIALRRGILSDLHIWRKMTRAEKDNFNSSTTELHVDNLMVSLRRKYL